MVNVSLEKLVAVPNTRELWPAEFAALVDRVAAEHSDATGWLALADWLQENGEGGLERAARWLAKRGGAGVRSVGTGQSTAWSCDLPPGVEKIWYPAVNGISRSTPAGLLAAIAAALRVIDEEIG